MGESVYGGSKTLTPIPHNTPLKHRPARIVLYLSVTPQTPSATPELARDTGWSIIQSTFCTGGSRIESQGSNVRVLGSRRERRHGLQSPRERPKAEG